MSSVNQRTRIGIAATAIALSTLTIPAGFAAAAEADDCVAEGNVWVVVEHDSATVAACATEFADGIEALTSAGIPYVADGGFMTTMNGEPQTPGAEDWWSYWTAVPAEDGSLVWESYPVGAPDARPEAGSVEGWRLAHSFTEEAPPPSVAQLDAMPEQSTSSEPESSDQSDDDSSTGLLLTIGAVVLLAAAGAVVLWRRRRAV